MKNGDMPATGHAGRIDENGFACAPGLTKRELIAAMAMQGIRATMTNGHARYADVAESAVAQADALLARLERSP
ncbi:TPA: hypothetical protein UM349_000322 [Stenotrophomonas maltophilia]|nr:hypothetical protein [Stenotrophomonas maltophilia]